MFATTTRIFTKSEDLFLNVETIENGKEKSKIKKAIIPRLRTGSEIIFLIISLNKLERQLF
tara:strand:+ start:283 stop:465 length:183 start_codon:yes stop_codon:yes gene_type:complete